MTQARRTVGVVVLACLLIPPVIIGGLLKAGHYTFVTWRQAPHEWLSGHVGVEVNDNSVPGYALVLNNFAVGAYRPQDVPHRYVLSAQVTDRQGHGISGVTLDVYDLSGVIVDDPDLVVRGSGFDGRVSYGVPFMGAYNVVVNRRGYLPIKKRVQIGPNGGTVRFVLDRAGRGGVPSRRLPANARS